MRFTTAIAAALTVASIGVQAAPTPDEPVKSSSAAVYTSSSTPSYSSSAAPYKPTDKVDYKHDDKGHEYELVCKDFAFFHNWDITCGDLECGPSKGKWIYDCAKDCLETEGCDATVSFEGYCYPKTLKYFEVSNIVKSWGRDLAIEGCCEDLKENYKKTKCYPDGFLDCCYDKKICHKVYKDGYKKPKKDDYKKEDDKKEEEKKS